MAKKRTKTLIFNTLLLVFCCVIIALYSLNFNRDNGAKKALLKFDTEGGSSIVAIEIGECQVVDRPADPTKDGYIFKGWTLNGEEFDFTQEVCGDVELKAVWEEAESGDKTYITFYLDKGDGSENVPVKVEEGAIPERPEDPTREGYDFVGWEKDGVPYEFDTPLEDNDVLVGQWTEHKEEKPEDPNAVYEVTFNLNGGTGTTPAKQSVKTGEKATIPTEVPTRDKYDFVGWGTSKTGSANISSTVIKKNTVFYAIWKSNVKTYKVTINLGGGSATKCTTKQTVEENSHPTGCTAPKRNNYGFVEWTDGTNSYLNLSQFVITKDTTITAVWEQYSYSITYNLNGGTSSDSLCRSSSPKGGKTYQLTVCPSNKLTPPVFKKLNNFKDGSGKTYSAGSKIELSSGNSSITLTAQYSDTQYTITCQEQYNANNGKTNTCKPSVSPSISGLNATIYTNGQAVTGTVSSLAVGKLNWEICVNNKQQCASSVTAVYKE